MKLDKPGQSPFIEPVLIRTSPFTSTLETPGACIPLSGTRTYQNSFSLKPQPSLVSLLANALYWMPNLSNFSLFLEAEDAESPFFLEVEFVGHPPFTDTLRVHAWQSCHIARQHPGDLKPLLAFSKISAYPDAARDPFCICNGDEVSHHLNSQNFKTYPPGHTP
jgi:hypothetical protein